MKKFLMLSGLFLALSVAIMPVLAEDVSVPIVITAKSSTADKIACVRTAVAARESTIASAVAVQTQAVHDAYATRALELDGAYSNSNVKAVQAGVKVSWADFNKSIKSATAKWRASRNTAWSTFRTATKTCKSPAGVTDSANSGSELSGQ